MDFSALRFLEVTKGCRLILMSLFFLEEAEEEHTGLVYDKGFNSRDEFI